MKTKKKQRQSAEPSKQVHGLASKILLEQLITPTFAGSNHGFLESLILKKEVQGINQQARGICVALPSSVYARVSVCVRAS